MQFPRAELIQGKLYFEVRSHGMKAHPGVVYFSTQLQFPELPGRSKHGLTNISQALKAFVMIESVLVRVQESNEKAVFYAPHVGQHVLNGASTVGLFLVLHLNVLPQTITEAFAPLWNALYDAEFAACQQIANLANKESVQRGNSSNHHFPAKNGKNASLKANNAAIIAFDALLQAAWRAQHCCVFSARAFSPQTYDFYYQRQNGSFIELLSRRLFGFVVAYECGLRPSSFRQLLGAAQVKSVLCVDGVFYETAKSDEMFLDVHTCPLVFSTFPNEQQLVVIYRLFANEQQPFAICTVSDLRLPAVIMCILLIKFYKFTAPQAVAWAECIMGSVLGEPEVRALESYANGLINQSAQQARKNVKSKSLTATTQQEPTIPKADHDSLLENSEDTFDEPCTYQLLDSQKINMLASKFVNVPAKQLHNRQTQSRAPPKIKQLPPCRYIIKAGRVIEMKPARQRQHRVLARETAQ